MPAHGAVGAIDHHERVRRRYVLEEPVKELAARTIDRARDVHDRELAERPRVENDEVVGAVDHRGKLPRIDMRSAGAMLDELPERLAGHVDAGEQLVSGLRPGGHATMEHCDAPVA